MSDEVYRQLATVLDKLSFGFPSAENGSEIRLLKKVFEPDEAELFCKMKLTYETPEQIARRTGIPQEGLENKLFSMWKRGLVDSERSGEGRVFRMMPWLVGVMEYQIHRLDKEFVELFKEYVPAFVSPFLMSKPQVLQVVPIEKELPTNHEALPYEKVSSIIEQGKSFAVNDCMCRKMARLGGEGCEKPLETCMYISSQAGAYDEHAWGGRVISKEEAFEILQKSEEAALVHTTLNFASGNTWICNCCGCCDGWLKAINLV